ncbi:flagellar assembly protein FliH [Yersinia mollaretii]|uniref:flagellar assembly protein FliH n=1 Tax=Yersinia mollaretii TaxID=33060 RepID=UPI0005E417E9|nr:flagellar assembly protein FliH [Yersinia mollaretii]CNK42587.1 flagellar assembly protein H [Yersinia mollaretii]
MSDREQKLNWQSWQPQSLLDEEAQSEDEIIHLPGDYQPDELLQAELSRLRQQAEKKGFAQGESRGVEEGKKQGYEAGLSQGKKEGLEQGLSEAREQQQETGQRFSQLLEEFKVALDNLDSVIPSRLVQLSLTAARAILGKNIVCDNAVLLEKIQQLLQQETLFKGKAQLWVNPADIAIVEQNVGKSLESLGWELREDAQILLGGCRITSAEGEFDATMTARWQALCELAREDYPA